MELFTANLDHRGSPRSSLARPDRIPLSQLARHSGKAIRVELHNGRTLEGTLLRTSIDALQLKQRAAAGSLLRQVPLDEVSQVLRAAG